MKITLRQSHLAARLACTQATRFTGERTTELVPLDLIAFPDEADADLFNRTSFNYATLDEPDKYPAYDAVLKRTAIRSKSLPKAVGESPQSNTGRSNSKSLLRAA